MTVFSPEQQIDCAPIPDSVLALLDQYADIFAEPQGLPPVPLTTKFLYYLVQGR